MTEQKEDTAELLQKITCKSSTLRAINDEGYCNRTILWRAVIMRAFQDAGLDLSAIKTDFQYRNAYNIRAVALVWLRGHSEDFCQVCDLAKCNSEAVRDAARTMFNDLIDELQIPIDARGVRAILAARSVES